MTDTLEPKAAKPKAAKPAPAQVAAPEAPVPSEPRPAIGSLAFHELTSEERTQIISDARFAGPSRFRCGHRDCPTIDVSANSPEEARGRYQDLCGITSSGSQFTVEPI